MHAMSHRREGILAQIETGAVDDTVPVASLLQKCIVLGGQAGSEKMRDWARQELNGYSDGPVPDYRRVNTTLVATITNSAGYNPITQRVSPSVFPRKIIDLLRSQDVDLEVAVLGSGVGELQALANSAKGEHHIMPGWADIIIDTLNRHNMAPNSRVQYVYWPLTDASLWGVLVRIRTALAEMVAELIALTPPFQEVPDRAAADQAVNLVITGERNTVMVAPQQVVGEHPQQQRPAATMYSNHVGSISGSSGVQIGNAQATQHVNVGLDPAALRELVAMLQPQLGQFGDAEPEAQAALNEVAEEAESAHPNQSRVVTALTKVAEMAVPVGARMAVEFLRYRLQHWGVLPPPPASLPPAS
jgi:hypothetical protein